MRSPRTRAGAPPQRLSSQPVGIEPEVPAGPLPSSFGKQGDERQGTAIEAPADEAVPPPLSLWPAPPFPTRERPRNELDRTTRLFWIGVVLIGLILAASLFIALAVRYSRPG